MNYPIATSIKSGSAIEFLVFDNGVWLSQGDPLIWEDDDLDGVSNT